MAIIKKKLFFRFALLAIKESKNSSQKFTVWCMMTFGTIMRAKQKLQYPKKKFGTEQFPANSGTMNICIAEMEWRVCNFEPFSNGE